MKLTMMLLLTFSTLVTLASSLTAYSSKRKMTSLFCFISQECPDMQICRDHQCRVWSNLREYLTASKIYNSRQRQVSSEGQKCEKHSDCKHIAYLCDFDDGVCRISKLVFPKIKKCKDFKKSCRTNADCSCPGKYMICEAEQSGTESECVFRNRKSSHSITTKRHAHSKDGITRDSIDWYRFLKF